MAGDDAVKCPVCNKPAVHRCSSCKQVSYCSKEHQKMDWKKHKNACKAFEIRSSDQLGRYLVAARDLNPGDIIIQEAPLIWAPKSLFDAERLAPCVGCYVPVNLNVGERCTSCGWPICSGHCKGLKDPNHHGLECLVLSLRPGCAVSNLGDYYRHDALLTLRILLSQKRFHKKYQKIMELQSHLDDRKGTVIYQEVNEFIVKYLQDSFLHPLRSVETELKTNIVPDISDKLLHTICGIIDVNCLEVNLNNGSELSALYYNTCMMEHNCTPNTKHSFDVTDEYKIVVKAALPIKKGENITTMYSHALWGTQARREHLKDTKYFSCDCQRCRDPTEFDTNLSAMLCIGDGKNLCGGIQLPDNPIDPKTEWSCDKCPAKIKNEEVTYLTSQMGENVDQVQAASPNIAELEELLKKLSTFLHQNHYHMYSVKHSLVQLYGHQYGYLHDEMTMDMLENKANMCDELIKITEKIDPGNTRLCLYTGVLYHELFQARFEILKRKVEKKLIKRVDLAQEVVDVKMLTRYGLRALEDEWEGSPGHKLTGIIRESDKKFLDWTTVNKC